MAALELVDERLDEDTRANEHRSASENLRVAINDGGRRRHVGLHTVCSKETTRACRSLTRIGPATVAVQFALMLLLAS